MKYKLTIKTTFYKDVEVEASNLTEALMTLDDQISEGIHDDACDGEPETELIQSDYPTMSVSNYLRTHGITAEEDVLKEIHTTTDLVNLLDAASHFGTHYITMDLYQQYLHEGPGDDDMSEYITAVVWHYTKSDLELKAICGHDIIHVEGLFDDDYAYFDRGGY